MTFNTFLTRAFTALIVINVAMPVTFAQSEYPFPRGCEPIGFQFKRDGLVLAPEEPGKQTIYMINNAGDRRMEITYELHNQALVGESKTRQDIDIDRWGAFALNKDRLTMHCALIMRGKKRKPVACNTVLQVCQYPRAKFSLSHEGSYWVAHNRTRNGIVRATIREGILLRW